MVLDVSYLVAAAGAGAIVAYKTRALFTAPREGRRTILPLWVGALCVALAFVLMAPVVGIALDRWTGVPNLSVLLIYCLSVGLVCNAGLLVVNWRHSWPAARVRTAGLLAGNGLVVVALCVLFLLASHSDAEDHDEFLRGYAGQPYLGEFLVIYYAAFSVGFLGVIYQAWRGARETPPDQKWLRRGIELTTIGFAFPAAYGLVSLVTVTAPWFGVRLGDTAPEIALEITPIGVFEFLVGISIAAWGHRLGAIPRRLRDLRTDLRDYRQLTPLWRLLREVDPTMVHSLPTLRERLSLETRLWYRIVEIDDWLERLHPYRPPEIGPGREKTWAVWEATATVAALGARGRGEKPCPAPREQDAAPPTQHAFAGERHRLVLLADAISRVRAGETAR